MFYPQISSWSNHAQTRWRGEKNACVRLGLKTQRTRVEHEKSSSGCNVQCLKIAKMFLVGEQRLQWRIARRAFTKR